MQGEDMVVRTTCAAYVASFLARYTPLPLKAVVETLESLCNFASQYAARAGAVVHRSGSMPGALGGELGRPMRRWTSTVTSAPAAAISDWQQHEIFYAVCQALMYSLCYHMHRLVGSSDAGQNVADAGALQTLRGVISCKVVPLVTCPLQPLTVCLPTVSREFCKQVSIYQLGQVDAAAPARAGTRVNRPFEMFFPFDPYLLPASAPHLDLPATYRAWRRGHVVQDGGVAGVGLEDAAASDDEDDRGDDNDDEDDGDGDDESDELESQSDLGESPRMSDMGASVPVSPGVPAVPAPSQFNPFALLSTGARSVARPQAVASASNQGGDVVFNPSSTSDGYLYGQSYASSMQDVGHSPDGAMPMSLSDGAMCGPSSIRAGAVAQRGTRGVAASPAVIHTGWPMVTATNGRDASARVPMTGWTA
jgi:RNA polymerase I-specific transcription initiation factor RRN3